MKNKSLQLAAAIALVMLSMVFLQCSQTTDESTSLVEAADSTPVMATETSRMDTNEAPAPVPELTETVAPDPAPSTTQPIAKQPEQPAAKKEVVRPATSTETKTQAEPVVAPVATQETVRPDPAPVIKPKPEVKVTAATPAAPVLQSVNFSFQSGKGEVQGTSSLHAWTSAVTGIDAKGSFQLENNVIGAIQDLSVKIPVTGIKSKEGSKMDDKTYETFNSDSHPFITFTCKNAPVTIDAGQNVNVVASGTLSMAGSSKSVTLSAKGKQLPNGDLQLSFSKKLNMKDYQMEPPVMMLGTIKVGEEITVSFDFVLKK